MHGRKNIKGMMVHRRVTAPGDQGPLAHFDSPHWLASSAELVGVT